MLASDAKVEDAGAPGEIEVTPEMVEAGLDTLYGFPITENYRAV
jgi:hypothetical protein